MSAHQPDRSLNGHVGRDGENKGGGNSAEPDSASGSILDRFAGGGLDFVTNDLSSFG